MKKVLFTARQLLIGVLLLQLINLSLCSESYWEYYNYSSTNSYDPTETIVEWMVEWKKGNQDAFSYANNISLKGLCKSFAWHVDIQHGFYPLLPVRSSVSADPGDRISPTPAAACIEILSPPPEYI